MFNRIILFIVILAIPLAFCQAQTTGSKSVDPFKKSSLDKTKKAPTSEQMDVFKDVLDTKIQLERKTNLPINTIRKDVLESLQKEEEGENPFGDMELPSESVESVKPQAPPKKTVKKDKKNTSNKDLFSEYDSVIAKGIADLFPKKK